MSTDIDTIILEARNRVNEYTADTGYLMEIAQNHVNELQAVDIEVDQAPEWPIDEMLEPVDLPDIPTLDAGAGITPSMSRPSTPDFVLVRPAEPATQPENEFERPTLDVIDPPTPIDPLFSDQDGPLGPPEIRSADDFEFPRGPPQLQYQFEPAPVIADREIPDAPEIVFPEFAPTDPGAAPEAPTDLADRYLSVYREQFPSMVQSMDGYVDAMILRFNPEYHAQMARLEDKLEDWIDNGGTALKPEIEEAIWDRSRERQAGEFRRVQETAWSAAAAKGFTMPNGAILGAVLSARMAEADANTRTSNEIAIKQAELEQQNIQFAITTSMDLRKTIISSAMSYIGSLIQINGQASDAARAIVQALVDVYNGQVKQFEARLSLYRAEADVYETQHRGLLAEVEIYKAQLSAIEAQTDIDTAKLNAYKVKIDSLQTLATVYRAQVDAVIAQAGMEKIKLELFESHVRAYSAKVQAKNAEWTGYEAQLRGQQIKMQTYDQELRVYQSDLQAWQSDLEAKLKLAEADLRHNENLIRQYQAEYGAYEGDIKAQGLIQGALIDAQKIQLQSVQTKYQQAEAEARLNFEKQVRATQFTTDNYRYSTDTNFRRLSMEIDRLKYLSDFAKANSAMYGTLASSALAGMNTLVSQST